MNQTNPLAMSGATIEALTFNLRGETFALDAGLVREVLDLLPETAIPGSPPFAAAVINFRGRVIPLIDLGLAFGLPTLEATRDSRIIVIEFEIDGLATLLGLRADKVYEVATIEQTDTEHAPSVGLRWRQEFILGLAKRGGDLTVIPNLSAIFAAQGRADPSFSPLIAA